MPNLFDDPNDPYLYLDFNASHGTRWVPSGGNRGTQALKVAFETLVVGGSTIAGGQSGTNIMQLIPAGTPDIYDARGRTQNGFNFEWNDLEGKAWHVHAHEPDHEAPAGAVAGRSWVIRIYYGARKSARYLRNVQSSDTRANPWWTKAEGDEGREASHIEYTED